ncbi:MAG TPA: hypothetical protein VNH11_20720 [Pirellulales bacterium]|nr:hypothetical protein [Pirellulales bacterium]
MGNTCTDLPGSAVETVALAFDLVDYEAKNGPAQIVKVLQSDDVQKAIKDALDKQGKAFLQEQQQGKLPSANDAANQLGSALGKAATDAGSKQLVSQVKNTGQYQRVQNSLNDLKCAYEKSVVGVWIDEHKALLIVVASGLAVGGATVMYLTKTGDTPADWATSLAKDALPTISLGQLKLGSANPVFKPSTRDLGLKTYVDTGKWKPLPNTDFSVTVHVTDGKLTTLQGALQTKIPIGQWTLPATAHADPLADKYSLSLGIQRNADGLNVGLVADFEKDRQKETKGVSGTLDYKTRIGSVPLDIAASAGIKQTTQPNPMFSGRTNTQTDVRGNISLTIPLSFLP